MKARAISAIVAALLLFVGFVYAQQPPAEPTTTPYDPTAPSQSAPPAASAPPTASAPATAPATDEPPPFVGPGPVKPEPFGPKALPQPVGMDRPPEKPRSRGPDGKLIGGIIAAVIGAGALVTFGVAQGQIAYLQDDPGFEKYRRGLAPSQSACDEAEAGRVVNVGGASAPADVADLCKSANTYELASYVLLPTGIVMLGLGGFLIFTSDTARGRASLEIVPRVGWNRGAVDLVVSF